MGKKEDLIPSLVLIEDQQNIPKRGGKYVSKSAVNAKMSVEYAKMKERMEEAERKYNSCHCNCNCDCDKRGMDCWG